MSEKKEEKMITLCLIASYIEMIKDMDCINIYG